MRRHELKTWPEPFQAVIDERKRYEIRIDDRGFAVGDVLELREWNPGAPASGDGSFTGRWCSMRVTYMTPGGNWGLPGNVCVMSVEKIESGPLCTNMSPPWFTGRWRDWHRGHGCDKDDGKPRTRDGQAEIDEHERAEAGNA